MKAGRALRSREAALGVVLAAVILGFAVASPAFRRPPVVLDQSRYWLEIGILAAALFGVIAAGGIDLSVASILALCGVAIVRIHAEAGLPIGIAALVGLGLGALAGAVNGIAAAYARIPDLIVTLATMVVYRGVAQLVAQNRVYSNLPAGYRWIGEGTLLGTVPVGWLVLLVCWAIAFALLHRARLGRYAFAIGASPRAARSAGVPARAVRVLLYTLSGLAAAASAIVYTARNNTAKSDDALGFELEAITCVLLGGASISGGRGTLLGTILGVLVVGFLRTGLVLTGVSELYRRIAVGAILIIAAAWNERVAARGPALPAGGGFR